MPRRQCQQWRRKPPFCYSVIPALCRDPPRHRQHRARHTPPSSYSTFPSANATPLCRCIARSSSTWSHHAFRDHRKSAAKRHAKARRQLATRGQKRRKTAKNAYPLSYTNLFGYNHRQAIRQESKVNNRNAAAPHPSSTAAPGPFFRIDAMAFRADSLLE
jgi:hypothetical protein